VELRDAILTENVALIKSVKGIGLKTAQRIIVDLKDKIGKSVVDSSLSSVISVDKSEKTEAVSALVMLGFQQNAALKVVEKIVREQPSLTLEQIIKLALKML
jgi:Holliday junction DNA helicase RuvA